MNYWSLALAAQASRVGFPAGCQLAPLRGAAGADSTATGVYGRHYASVPVFMLGMPSGSQ